MPRYFLRYSYWRKIDANVTTIASNSSLMNLNASSADGCGANFIELSSQFHFSSIRYFDKDKDDFVTPIYEPFFLPLARRPYQEVMSPSVFRRTSEQLIQFVLIEASSSPSRSEVCSSSAVVVAKVSKIDIYQPSSS